MALSGKPEESGRKYGQLMKEKIRENVAVLIERKGIEIIEGVNDVPLNDKEFIKWEKEQEKILREIAPYLIDEMGGIAEGSGVDYRYILLLNLRAWQYRVYFPETTGCSSFAITLKDRTVACTGALDDPYELYCGPVHIVPEKGYRFITFPITGTVWGNRGMNSEGLTVGISSQLLRNLRPLPGVINQDIAIRVILQNFSTVKEVRDFCKKHPFAMNILCVDRSSNIFCAHQTPGGLFEIPVTEGYFALTNHIVDDGLMYLLMEKGVDKFLETDTTRLRRGNLLEFARRYNGRCTGKDVMDFIEDRKGGSPAAICNKGTIVLTYANPEPYPDTFWINYLGEDKEKRGFSPVKI